jgi:6-pyruvoyltetrahydropterin/6-carboxytetrahydropterin synthase
MVVELSQRFYFEAAHTLRRALEKDSGLRESSLRIHGHTYHAEVTLRGEPSPETGMLIDLASAACRAGRGARRARPPLPR